MRIFVRDENRLWLIYQNVEPMVLNGLALKFKILQRWFNHCFDHCSTVDLRVYEVSKSWWKYINDESLLTKNIPRWKMTPFFLSEDFNFRQSSKILEFLFFSQFLRIFKSFGWWSYEVTCGHLKISHLEKFLKSLYFSKMRYFQMTEIGLISVSDRT